MASFSLSQGGPPKSTESGGRKGPVLLFVLKVFGLMVAYYTFAASSAFDRVLNLTLVWTAKLSSGLLITLGKATTSTDSFVRSAHFVIHVRRGCDAVEPAWLFCAAVVAFPAAWWQRAWGAIAGTVALFAINVLRVASLFLIGDSFPTQFDAAHLEIWPVLLIASALALWIVWIRWVRPKDSAN